jgi:hypothetical protein
MDYLDSGFNDFLLRPLEADYTEQVGLDSSSSYEKISGSQVKGDQIVSASKRLTMDLENETFTVSDGNVSRVELGKLSDGNIGLIIRDDQGNTLMQISGATNIIKSPNNALELDFNEERILVRDQGGTPVILLGKQINGF